MMPRPSTVLQFEGVSMLYAEAGGPGRRVLDAVDLQLDRGQSLALVGRSGSGKSTLLHIGAGIAQPTSGQVRIAGHDLARLNESRRTRLRRDHVGIVFQFFHLLPHLDVSENIALPGWISRRPATTLRTRVAELLERVGLTDRACDPVGQLSGGEMQRVAICRALLNKPALLLADEPTGSLDDTTGKQVLDLLFEMAATENCGVLYATHSRELAGRAQQTLELQDGRLVEQGISP